MQQIGFNSLKIRSLQDFKVVSTFSSTKFGSVSFALYIPTRQYMILKYRISSELKPNEASKESATYIKIGPHPHVCRFLGYCLIDRRMIMALQHYPLGDLRAQIQRHRQYNKEFNYQHVWYLFLHMGKALHHVHQKGYIFADLKPGNVLLAEEIYSNTFGCGITYIDEDMFARDCNCNFLLCDFGHALEAYPEKSHQTQQPQFPQARYQYLQENDKVYDMMSVKRVTNSVNEIAHSTQQIMPSELLSTSPRRRFSTAEVVNYEITRCGTFAYQSAEQRRGGVISNKTDIYSLALVGLEMLTLRKRSEVSDAYFECIDDDLKRFMKKMLGPEAYRPSAFDVYQKAVNVLQCRGFLVQDAVKNTSELLMERMVEIYKASSPENSIYVRPPSGRPSSSRPVSSSVSYRKSRPQSYAETLTTIINEQERDPDVIGKQAVPSPVVEKLLRTTRFLDKWNRAHWDWDVDSANVIDPKQNYCTDSVIGEFGLGRQIERFEISQHREQNLHSLQRGSSSKLTEASGAESGGPQHRQVRGAYLNTRGGGAVVKSTCSPANSRTSVLEYAYRSSSPYYRSLFYRHY